MAARVLGLVGLMILSSSWQQLPAQTPSWGTTDWNFPSTTSPVFQCVEVFPRQPTAQGTTVDPGVPSASAAYMVGCGIRAFRDDKGTPLDPNDDEEYLVAARSDGILLAKVTPPRATNPSLNPGLPAYPGSFVTFFAEPNPNTTDGNLVSQP